MAYIGKVPTAVPLTTSDLADGIITSSKIADGTIATADIQDGAVTSVKTTGVGGKILQVVSGTDNTKYSISTSSQTDDYAGSTAFSITPSATSSKIMIQFFVGHVMSQNGSGLRFRIYRQIGGSGGFTNVTALGGADENNRRGAVAGNFGSHSDAEDENRSRTLAGTVVDSPNTTSTVEYKLYYGSGDTTPRAIYVNRTRGDSNNYYTNNSITHVTLLEVSA